MSDLYVESRCIIQYMLPMTRMIRRVRGVVGRKIECSNARKQAVTVLEECSKAYVRRSFLKPTYRIAYLIESNCQIMRVHTMAHCYKIGGFVTEPTTVDVDAPADKWLADPLNSSCRILRSIVLKLDY